MNKLVVDGNNATLGRLASFVAKKALLGNEIIIVNCENVVISGKPKSIIGEYQVMRKKGGSSLKGPFFPKMPERIVKRTIRGMLSYKQKRGSDALKRIICYNQTPEEFKEVKKIISGKGKNISKIKLKSLSSKI
ncbi:TPA: 50S ribosomal protein L13 [Candidatus Pacearchaeota archaeon]|jgi:large subunit ribosomal protein L13|nr:50S ribosomal protein L13 [Candidatus Pacearchaeota archaeon]